MANLTKANISIFVIWLFNVSGIIGILSVYSDWFLALTPLNLLLYSFFIIINAKKIGFKFFLAFLVPFLFGFVTEFLGVNFGLIFGDYAYGNNLGYKIRGVPITICFNWAVLVIASGDISSYFLKNKWSRALFVGLVMTLLDAIIEVSAPRFDFWEFDNSIVPIQNYIGWFVIATIASYCYQQFKIKTNTLVSVHTIVAIAVFFVTFLFV